MSASELLITVVIVTVLVTVLLVGVTYLGRRFDRRGSTGGAADPPDGSRYFVRFLPGSEADLD